MSRQPIQATPASQPRYSLLGVAQALTTLSERVFGAGWTTNPEQCGTSRGGIVQAECGGDTEPLTAPGNPAIVGGDPFVVWAADECSTLGWQARDFTGRATRQLLAVQSYWIAKQIAGGGISTGGQAFLNDGGATVATDGTELDAVAVLAKVETAMAAKLRGERGMVHVTIAVLDQLVAEFAIRLDGTVWVTPTGNVVVADAGYAPVLDHGDGTSRMIGTSMIAIGLDNIMTIPGPSTDPEALVQMVDRSINLITLYAERSFVYVWDECCHVKGTVPAFTGLGGGGGGGGGDASAANQVTEIARLTSIRDAVAPTLVTDGERTADHHITTAEHYFGFSAVETSGTDPATAVIRAGTDGSGAIIEYVNLAANETARELYPVGVPTGGDIFIDVLTGALSIVVRYAVA